MMRIYDLAALLLRLLLSVGSSHRLGKVCEGMWRPLQLKQNTLLCRLPDGTHAGRQMAADKGLSAAATE